MSHIRDSFVELNPLQIYCGIHSKVVVRITHLRMDFIILSVHFYSQIN